MDATGTALTAVRPTCIPAFTWRLIVATCVGLLVAAALSAHVGSSDVFLDGAAGRYRLLVAVRPPDAIPGVASLDIRSPADSPSQVRAVPKPMTGPGARLSPLPEPLSRDPKDPRHFTGQLWLMGSGSWEVVVECDGPAGRGVLHVPVPSFASRTKRITASLGIALSGFLAFLVVGLVAIVGAGTGQAQLDPGVTLDSSRKRRSQAAMAITAAVIAASLWAGWRWWSAEADAYDGYIYKPLVMSASLDPGGVLRLNLRDPGWLKFRKIDDFVPDHNHLMHLYAIRWPGLDRVYHLHPEPVEPGQFALPLPSMAGGDYRLYADVVHNNGFPETLVATVALPQLTGRRALAGDDAAGVAELLGAAPMQTVSCRLPDGYRMDWLDAPVQLRSRQPLLFRFALVDRFGRPAPDVALYMGMLGHAAFLKSDGTVFAHLHPAGSVSMAALMLAHTAGNPATASGMQRAGSGRQDSMMDMPGMATTPRLPHQVSFPYGFPTPGRYRIFVQMKHGTTVETGWFDAMVTG